MHYGEGPGEGLCSETLLDKLRDLLIAQTVIARVAGGGIVLGCGRTDIHIAVVSGGSGIELSVVAIVNKRIPDLVSCIRLRVRIELSGDIGVNPVFNRHEIAVGRIGIARIGKRHHH